MADTINTDDVSFEGTAAAVLHPGAVEKEGRGEPVVHIDRLSIALPDGADRPFAVDRVSFKLFPGEMLCVVGESGSGKSMSANALLGLLPDTVRVAQGRILLGKTDLVTMPADALYAIRGRRVAMIFQEPMSALNPLMKVSAQIEEVFEAHGLLTPKERKEKALSLLTEVGLPDPPRVAASYPFQLSGGQRQTRYDCHGAGVGTGGADRRRADHRARCDDAGANFETDRQAPEGAQYGGHVHYP